MKKINLKHTLSILVIVLLLLTIFETLTILRPLDKKILRDGDFVFQTSRSNQSKAIIKATNSFYSHMGIIKKKPEGIFVIEAVHPVKETPLNEWIQNGFFSRIKVKRYNNLSEEQLNTIFNEMKKFYGNGYDIFFYFKNNKIYCSELPYISFQEINIKLGKTEKIKNLNFDNNLVEKLMSNRWKTHPLCKNIKTFQECKPIILDQELITPVSIEKDRQLSNIYSNYPTILDLITKPIISFL